MLTLTQNASAVVKQIVDQTGEDAGLRISQETEASQALDVVPTETPEEGDEVVESNGARVFLEESAARTLESQVLDAHVDENGGVQFSLAPQSA
ncbi:MAG: Fe-S cluster assembly protein HesB [Marmoricola sp.]